MSKKVLFPLVGVLSLVCLNLAILLKWPDSLTHVVFCDVGQGDAILIWQGFHQVVVDSGKDHKARDCLRKYLPWWDHQLEMVVATHADADHIGGFPAIFEDFTASQVLLTNQIKNSSDFHEFAGSISAQQQKGAHIGLATAGKYLEIAPRMTATVLWPLRSPQESEFVDLTLTETQLSAFLAQKMTETDNWNAGSIILLLQIGGFDILLTGDAETPTESALIDYALTKDIDLLKVGHHGSKNGTSGEFLQVFQPEMAVISNGQNNQYGHPSEEVMRSLVEKGMTISRTDQEGDVHLISNGTQFWFVSQRALNRPD